MQNIHSVKELRYAIESLEADQVVKGSKLKEDFFAVSESLRPVNILRSTIRDLTSSQYLVENIPGALMGLASGFLSRKLFIHGSGNIFRKLLGSLLQFGVTNVVAKNSNAIKSTGMAIFEHFLHKKVMNSKADAK